MKALSRAMAVGLLGLVLALGAGFLSSLAELAGVSLFDQSAQAFRGGGGFRGGGRSFARPQVHARPMARPRTMRATRTSPRSAHAARGHTRTAHTTSPARRTQHQTAHRNTSPHAAHHNTMQQSGHNTSQQARHPPSGNQSANVSRTPSAAQDNLAPASPHPGSRSTLSPGPAATATLAPRTPSQVPSYGPSAVPSHRNPAISIVSGTRFLHGSLVVGDFADPMSEDIWTWATDPAIPVGATKSFNDTTFTKTAATPTPGYRTRDNVLSPTSGINAKLVAAAQPQQPSGAAKPQPTSVAAMPQLPSVPKPQTPSVAPQPQPSTVAAKPQPVMTLASTTNPPPRQPTSAPLQTTPLQRIGPRKPMLDPGRPQQPQPGPGAKKPPTTPTTGAIAGTGANGGNGPGGNQRPQTTVNGQNVPINQGPRNMFNGLQNALLAAASALQPIDPDNDGNQAQADGSVALAQPVCRGKTAEGCFLRWQQVQDSNGGSQAQCVQYCRGAGPRAQRRRQVASTQQTGNGAAQQPAQQSDAAQPNDSGRQTANNNPQQGENQQQQPEQQQQQQGAQGCEVAIFAEPQFGGQSSATNRDQGQLENVGWSKQIASLDVRAGTWDFFSDENYGGSVMRLTAGAYPDLAGWSKQIGSFMCVQQPQ